MDFSVEDIEQIKEKGLTINKVSAQIELFNKGLPFVFLYKEATIENGIEHLSIQERKKYIDYFNSKKNEISLLKFVPASGAATRMFKFLFNFLKEFKPDEESINDYVNRKKASDLSSFFLGIKKFPFYNKVKQQLFKDHKNYDDLPINHRLLLFIETMLLEDKLDYGNYPKGLFPFHQYKNHIATAFEEHLYEAALYASSNKKANLHFTVSDQHQEKFQQEFNRLKEGIEKITNKTFNVSFSNQKQSTDTIAVTDKNIPVREDDGSLHFRPSGHGALIENLNDLDADIIFIKNIDNVVVKDLVSEIAEHKIILAGKLLKIQNQVFEYQRQLGEDTLKENIIIEIAEFLANELNVRVNEDFEKYSLQYQIEYLKEKINKPIRVCGMVKNEGEPGGGPFWVKEESGTISLQIVESAQIDMNNEQQKELFRKATHFNPVDLVCSVKNYKGEKYDLLKYVNPKTAFITMKNKNGKDIKALELPGLWNGSMANWNTIFVEVPLITFNPVKTVNDLLKDAHQIN